MSSQGVGFVDIEEEVHVHVCNGVWGIGQSNVEAITEKYAALYVKSAQAIAELHVGYSICISFTLVEVSEHLFEGIFSTLVGLYTTGA